MPDQTLDLSTFLAELEADRARLDIQIAGLRSRLGIAASENGAAPVGLGAVREPSAAGRVSPTEFFRMSVPEAVIAYLEIMKQPQTPKAIADGLKAGGILSEAKHFYANVFTALKRLKAAEKVVNTKRGWAPSWWFEGRSGGITEKKPKRHKKSVKGTQKVKKAAKAARAPKQARGFHAFMAERLKTGKTMKEAAAEWQKKKAEGA